MNATEAGEILGKKRQKRRTKSADVSKAATILARLGASKGGKARAAKLSPEERKRISHLAAQKAGESHRRRAALLRKFRKLEALEHLEESA